MRIYDVWVITSNPALDYEDKQYDLIGEHEYGRYEVTKLVNSLSKFGFRAKSIQTKLLRINNDIIYYGDKRIQPPDIILLRKTDRDGSQKVLTLEALGIRCVNTTQSHFLCGRKHEQLYILSDKIRIPKTWRTKVPFDDILLEEASRVIEWPMVLKPLSSQRGELVELCSSIDDIYSYSKKILQANKFYGMMLQEYIEGPTIVCWVVGKKIISAQIRTPMDPSKFFVSNHKDGAIRENYPITKQLEKLVLRSTDILGVEIAKVDVLKSQREYILCEVNSPGGFFGRDEYFESNHADDISKYLLEIVK